MFVAARAAFAENPFQAKVLPMSPAVRVKIVVAPTVRVRG